MKRHVAFAMLATLLLLASCTPSAPAPREVTSEPPASTQVAPHTPHPAPTRGTPIAVATIARATAADIVRTYASEMLGIQVEVARAGGLAANIVRDLVLPVEGQEPVEAGVDMAVESYAALLENGVASVSYGSGSVTGDVSADIAWASLGAFSLRAESAPADAGQALEMIKQTYPGLANLEYQAVDTQKGYLFRSLTARLTRDPETLQADVVPWAVLAGTVTGRRGRTFVFAVVGTGEFAATVQGGE